MLKAKEEELNFQFPRGLTLLFCYYAFPRMYIFQFPRGLTGQRVRAS